MYFDKFNNRNVSRLQISDYGPEPFVTNLEAATHQNMNFRTALWTGTHLQATLMDIPYEIGLEMHGYLDQFLYIVSGQGHVMMGQNMDALNYQTDVGKGSGIFIPAGTWHNLINTGNFPIKLYSVYAPVQHPHGTVHRTKEESDAAESK